MKVEQELRELEVHLKDNIEFIKNSSKSFDMGMISEAKRLAVSIRVLLHDTKTSKSLLGLLGEKDQLLYLNTAHPYNPNNLLSHMGLVGFELIVAESSTVQC